MVEELMDLYISPPCIAPPREAYMFWNHQSYALTGKGKSILRFVFFKQEFTPLETENLLRLEREIAKGIEIPMKIERENLLRFCYGTDWKTSRAVKNLKSFLEYRKTIPPDYKMLLPKVYRFFNTGTFYIHGRDYMFRPVLVFNLYKFDFKHNTVEDYVEYMVFLLEYIIHEMFIPGQIENWIIICDFNKRGIRSLPIKKIKGVSNILMQNFGCRLGATYVVNAPGTFSMLWSIVKPFLDASTLAKMKLTNKNTSEEMLECFNPLQIEEKYGGKAPNLQQYWPPYVPDSTFHNSKGHFYGVFGKDTYEEYFPKQSAEKEIKQLGREEEVVQSDIIENKKIKIKSEVKSSDECILAEKKSKKKNFEANGYYYQESNDNNHDFPLDRPFIETYDDMEQRKKKKKHRGRGDKQELMIIDVEKQEETREERRERRRKRRELRRQREEQEAALVEEEECKITEMNEEQCDEVVHEAVGYPRSIDFMMPHQFEDKEFTNHTEILSDDRRAELICGMNAPCGKINCQLM